MFKDAIEAAQAAAKAHGLDYSNYAALNKAVTAVIDAFLSRAAEDTASMREKLRQLNSTSFLLYAKGAEALIEETVTTLASLESKAASQKDVVEDAERWRALMGSGRIRILGTSGFEGGLGNYRHMGLEIWTEYAGSGFDNAPGRESLIRYADTMRAVLAATKEADDENPKP